MSQAPSATFAAPDEEPPVGPPATRGDGHREHVSLRGTTRGLEILITGAPTTASLGERLSDLLAEAPSFFAGSDARVVFEHPLPPGALSCLEEVATRFELRIVEINPLVIKRRRTDVPRPLQPEEVPVADLAGPIGPVGPVGPVGPIGPMTPGGSGPIPEAAAVARSTSGPTAGAPGAGAPDADSSRTASSPSGAAVAAAIAEVSAEIDLADAMPPGPRLVVGPVRSGTIVDHPGHLVVIGDVNPGAEVRAEGSILVLGRLRGVAHAAIARTGSIAPDRGFILALSLQPQQLRIGRMVARAGDADRPGGGAEIAYVAGETIVVERFLGRLPSGLAASM